MKQWRGLDRLKVERQKERGKERGWETDAETETERREKEEKKNIYATFQNISKISPPQHWHSTSQISAATPGLTLYKYLEILAH